jgi:hypothetical protein
MHSTALAPLELNHLLLPIALFVMRSAKETYAVLGARAMIEGGNLKMTTTSNSLEGIDISYVHQAAFVWPLVLAFYSLLLLLPLTHRRILSHTTT